MSEVMVNTILWFMSHRMKLMPMEDLSKVVSDYFRCEEVKEAKQLLYDKIPESVRPQNLKRFIHRQGSGKDKSAASANASDIYILLQTIENESTFSAPIFATVSCQFPPLDIVCVDAVALYTDVLELKREMNHLKMKNEKTVREVDALKMDSTEINRKMEQVQLNNATTALEAGRLVSTSVDGPEPADTYASKVSKSLPKKTVAKKNSKLDSSDSQPSNSQSLSKDEDGFKTFVKRKRPPKIGKKTTSSLKAVKPLHKALDIFVTRLYPSTSEEEIAQFVKSQFVDAKEVSCSSLKTRHNSYASFKISFSGVLFKNCLDAENWPEGVLVKRYYPPNSEKVNLDTYAESGSNLQHD